jgi:hypothetical protein
MITLDTDLKQDQKYVISINNNYVRMIFNGKYRYCQSINCARHFTNADASNALIHMPESIKYLAKIIDANNVKEKADDEVPLEEVKFDKSAKYILDKESFELLSKLSNYADIIDDKLEQADNKIRDIDEKINDLLHYIEFNNLNACKGYDAIRMLQARAQEKTKLTQYRNGLKILKNMDLQKSYNETFLPILREKDSVLIEGENNNA